MPKTLDEYFQLALRAEEKLRRKGEHNNKGRRGNNFKGKGNFGGRTQFPKGNELNHKEKGGDFGSKGGGYRGKKPNGRGMFGGSRRGPSVFTGRCYNCN